MNQIMRRPLMHLTLASLGTLALLTLQAIGQEPSVRVDLMPISLRGKLVAYYPSGNEIKKLEAFETGIGSPTFYKGSKTLRLFATEEDARPRAEGEPQPTPIATVSLPSNVRRVLLLPIAKPDNKLEIRAMGIDDNSLKAGDYRMFNLSTFDIAALIGTKPLRLKPGQTLDVSDSSLRTKDENLGVQIAYLKDDKQKLFYSGMWGHSVDARNYIFMINSGNPNSPISVRKFHDLPSVPSIGYEPAQNASP
jgi:hypothetical protein